MNTQFVFESKQKTVLLGLIALGVICLGITWFTDDEFHTRFWTNLLHNGVFFTGIAATALFFICAQVTIYAGWSVVVKRIWEGMSLYMMVGMIFLAIIAFGNVFHFHHLYHWNDAAAVASDKILKHKSSFLNNGWFLTATFVFLGAWMWFAYKLRQLSLREDEESEYGDFSIHKTMRKYAAAFMPIFGFTSAAAIWLWLMSIDSHWFSTMFAWYSTASFFVSMICTTILIALYLKSKGYMTYVTKEHFHDLGKYTFGFSIFWTYLWFSQFMLIWYANIGEETTYFKLRMDNFPLLYWANLVMNFVLPFFILIRNDTKRKFGSLGFAASLVLFGHWWDFFQMIKPGALKGVQEHREHAAHASHGGAEVTHNDTAHSAADATASAAAHVTEKTNEAVAHTTEVVKEVTHAAATTATDKIAEHTGNAAHAVTETVAQAAEHATTTVAHGDAHHAEAINLVAGAVEGFHYPGLLELGTFCGFAGVFLYFVFNQLSKASLLPKNDPYVQESLTHHVV